MTRKPAPRRGGKRKATEQIAWAVKSRYGWAPFLHTIEDFKANAIASFLGVDVKPWSHFYRQGYRCVRVAVREVRK